ncbi:MAG: aldo/keto reductase [Methylobacteriaceae bacterium]|nr:aldo/keto reductase [Methylobacteriaceae bacterium]
MEKRTLGKSGLAIAPLVFGGNVFGWTVDQPTAFKLLDAFVAAGFNSIDTANVYSVWVPGNKGGDSETIIGSWLKSRGNRDKVVIATKVGMEMAPGRKGLSRSHILLEAEDSLRRLQTDYIDLYYSHADDAATPIEETIEAHARLVKEGKVRAIGASNFTVARLAQSLKTSAERGYPRYEVMQPHYNLVERNEFEGELEALCVKEGLGVVTYFSLASGFLTGKYRSEADLAGRARGSRVKNYLNARGARILAAMDKAAAGTGASLAQIALAWQIGRPSVTAPIASATSVAQLDELLKATEIKLERATMAALDEASR